MTIRNGIINSVAGASILLTIIGFLSKGIGFVREIIYANKFGISIEFDLFLVSYTIQNLINTATIYLCQHYFIPAFNEENKISVSDGLLFLNRTFWLFTLTGLIIAALLFFFSGTLMEMFFSTFSDKLKSNAVTIFSIFLLTIPLNSGMSVIMAYQQSKFNFVTPAISLTILNVVIIILVLSFSNQFQIFILPISFVIGYLVSFILLLSKVKGDIKLLQWKTLFNGGQAKNYYIIISLIVIEGLSLSYVLLDRLFISEVSSGGISALNYAFVIFSLPISLFSIPLITTLFSKFSFSTESLIDDVKNAYSMIIFIILPISFLFYFWGDLLLISFYEGGKFTNQDSFITFSVLKFYSFGLIFISIYLLFVKMLYSLKKINYVLTISIVAFLIKFYLNDLFVEDFKQEGLALSTTLLYVFLMLSSLFLILFKLKVIKLIPFIYKFLLMSLNLTVAYMVMQTSVRSLNLASIWIKIISLVLFLFVFYFNSYILKIAELRIIISTVLNFIVNGKVKPS